MRVLCPRVECGTKSLFLRAQESGQAWNSSTGEPLRSNASLGVVACCVFLSFSREQLNIPPETRLRQILFSHPDQDLYAPLAAVLKTNNGSKSVMHSIRTEVFLARRAPPVRKCWPKQCTLCYVYGGKGPFQRNILRRTLLWRGGGGLPPFSLLERVAPYLSRSGTSKYGLSSHGWGCAFLALYVLALVSSTSQ